MQGVAVEGRQVSENDEIKWFWHFPSKTCASKGQQKEKPPAELGTRYQLFSAFLAFETGKQRANWWEARER